MIWQENKLKEGFKIRFLNPEVTFSTLWIFKFSLKSSNKWNEELFNFSKATYGPSLKSVDVMNAMLSSEPVEPELAVEVLKLVPNAEYKFEFDGDYNVKFTDPKPIAEAFSNFRKKSQRKWDKASLTQKFGKETFNTSIVSKTLDRLLSGQPVSPGVAVPLLRVFPALTFETVKVQRGRHKKMTLLEDLKKYGVKYGHISHGIGMDFHYSNAIKEAFLSFGIGIRECRTIQPWEIDSARNLDLHFFTNLYLPPASYPEFHQICKTHTTRIIPLYGYDFLEQSGDAPLPSPLRVGVVHGSIEDILCKELMIPDVVRVSGNALFEYDFLMRMLIENRVEAILINQDSLKHQCLEFNFRQLVAESLGPKLGQFIISDREIIRADPDNALTCSRHQHRFNKHLFNYDLNWRISREQLDQMENLVKTNADWRSISPQLKPPEPKETEHVKFEQEWPAWRMKLGIYAREECGELEKIITTKFNDCKKLFIELTMETWKPATDI